MSAGIPGLAAVNKNTPALAVVLSALAGLGIGGTIQPAVTMLTIISPDESIATITAASISTRLVGATIGYAINFNIFENKILDLRQVVTQAATAAGAPLNEVLALLFAMASNNATALEQFPPRVVQAAETAALDTYMGGFKLIYLVSIAFSGGAIIASCFLRDIKDYMVDRVAVELQ